MGIRLGRTGVRNSPSDPLCFRPLCAALFDKFSITCLGGGDRELPVMSSVPSSG